VRILFWNIQKKPLVTEVCDVIEESRCTIAGFAEMEENIIDEVIATLDQVYGLKFFRCMNPGCEKIVIIIKDNTYKVSLRNQNKDFSILSFEVGDRSYILGFVHLPSKLHRGMDQMRRACERLRMQVEIEEDELGIAEAILIGDFNLDPFEMAMISFSGLAATNGVACSQRMEITRDGEANRLFYNPMWTLYSEHKLTPGSHRYIRSGEDVVSWHFLDQVIIRPSLIESFSFSSLNLIKKTRKYRLVSDNAIPNLSDHLPLVCQFNF
jgi:hypothetical protein